MQFQWQKVYIGEGIDEAKNGVDRDSVERYDSPDIHDPDLSFCKFQKITRVTISCFGNVCQVQTLAENDPFRWPVASLWWWGLGPAEGERSQVSQNVRLFCAAKEGD